MNINLSTGENKIQQFFQMNTAETVDIGKVTKNSYLNDLVPGQLFEGKVQDITNDMVEILLSDDTTMNATMQESVNFNIGDSVVFRVKENSGSKVVITPFKSDSESPVIMKALEGSGLKINEKNISVVKGLMEQGQPLDKKTILDTLRMVNRFPDTNISDIVTLNKHGIPVNQDNINMFQAYSEGNGMIMDMMERISDDLPELLESVVSENSESESVDIFEKIMDSIIPDDEEIINTNREKTDIHADKVMPEKSDTYIEKEVPEKGNTNAEKAISEKGNTNAEKAISEKGNVNAEKVISEINGVSSKKVISGKEGEITEKAVTEKENFIPQNTIVEKENVTSKETIPEKGNAASEKPIPEKGNAVSEKPIPEKGNAVSEKPIPEKGNVVSEKPIPEKGNVVSEKPIPKKGNVVFEKPIPEKGNAVSEKPIPEKGNAVSEKPIPEKGNVVSEKPIPEKGNAVSEKPIPEKVMHNKENSNETIVTRSSGKADSPQDIAQRLKELLNKNNTELRETNEQAAKSEIKGSAIENAKEQLNQISQELTKKGDVNLKSIKDDIVKIFQSLDKEEKKEFVSGDELKNVIKSIVKKGSYILPEKLILSENPKNDILKTYEKINEKIEKLNTIIKNTIENGTVAGKDISNVMTSVKNAGQNLNFMNDLNQLAAYVQIPVKFSNQETEGELYVLNKNRQKTAADGLNAFLHFDLENLGATNIRLTLKNKSLRMSFELDSKESAELVEKHINELVEKLEDKGFIVNSSVEEVSGEEHNSMDEIFNNDAKSVSIKRYAFDMRT